MWHLTALCGPCLLLGPRIHTTEVRRTALRCAALVALVLSLPGSAGAQLVSGKHHFEPIAGVAFSTSNLLSTTTPMAFGITPFTPEELEECGPGETSPGCSNPVSTTISLDPGAFAGLRYTYNLNSRLSVEGEFTGGVSVFVIEMLEHFPPDDERSNAAEPQFETTTMDARIYQYMFNLSYYFARWGVANPYFTGGLGARTMDLRQKGDVNVDSIKDGMYMLGAGINFNVNERLRIRFDVRDVMYNFSFDNQFAGRRSDEIVSFRDIGQAVEVASPEFQNDIYISLGFAMTAF